MSEQIASRPGFPFDSAPFLDQSRAQNTLRHELEDLFSTVESHMDEERSKNVDAIVELSIVPNRIIARRGGSATSFSWLGGRLGDIRGGRLLVIEWSGIPPQLRGTVALKSATSSRETSYHAEAMNAATWCWRAGDATGRACSTRDLVGEWLR